MEVLTKMHTRVYTKMSTEMPTRVEDFCAKRTTRSPWRLPRQCSREIWERSQKCARKCARSIVTRPIFTRFVSCPVADGSAESARAGVEEQEKDNSEEDRLGPWCMLRRGRVVARQEGGGDLEKGEKMRRNHISSVLTKRASMNWVFPERDKWL